MAAGLGVAQAQPADPAKALQAQYQAHAQALKENPFQRPIHLESTQAAGKLKGDVYAVIEHPFSLLQGGLQDARHWCDILILHLNVKRCLVSGAQGVPNLAVLLGRKHDQPLIDGQQLSLSYRRAMTAPGYFQISLSADNGPLGTQDYLISVEAIPLEAGRSFMHMSYAYRFGMAARLAMQTYLATLGRNKVGFSVVGKTETGEPRYVDGVRGVIERNTMRYYLAIDAYLDAMQAAPAEQVEARLQGWITSVERYPRQLHEMEREDYLAMKREQIQQQAVFLH